MATDRSWKLLQKLILEALLSKVIKASLKTYYPMEFMVAIINNFGGFYSRELYFHEFKKRGATLYLPCINESHYLTSINGSNIHLGSIHVRVWKKH
jgi:DNA polymerase III alpha subunit